MQDPKAKANTNHAMGALVRISTDLGVEDGSGLHESGLTYFKHALELDSELDSETGWVMLGIATTFGKHIPDHHEAAAF